MGRDNLAELFAELSFTKGAEIGVDRGEYSEVLCKANHELQLFGIDPWRSTEYEKGKSGVDEEQKYFDTVYEEAKKKLELYNCKIIKKGSMEAVKDFDDNSLDFVYIDANHDFVNITNDLHFWLKKVRPGGIVSGHDYAFYPTRKFNHVKRVVDAYMQSYRMFPYFIVGAFTVDKGLVRDKYRSWFWVKR